MEENYYDILGISRDATDAEIKKAYRKLSLELHPDRQSNKSDTEKKAAEEKFKKVTAAYNVLSDPEKKQKYDTFGSEMDSGGPDFGDFFSHFNPFGGNPFGGFSRREFVQAGKDITMKIPVSIEDLFNGLKKTVKFKRDIRCVNCHGEGGTGKKSCPHCNGRGVIRKVSRQGNMTFAQEMECPHCHGTGSVVDKKCPTCNGTGFKEVYNTVNIEFPAGIPNGAGIPYRGEGSESNNRKGSNGNFIPIAVYNFDTEKYNIEGANVIEHVYIPYYDILLGCNYEVNIPNGHKKVIVIDPCTKEETLLKIAGEGLPMRVGKGDYYVCIHYKYPNKLSAKEKEYIEQIKKLKDIK